MEMKDRIKALCKQNGTNLKKVEIELGFAEGYLSKIHKPTSENLQKIADYFSVGTDFLLGIEDKRFSDEYVDLAYIIASDMELMASLRKYYTLDDNKKKIILDMINTLSEV